jgi:hypothetical protein
MSASVGLILLVDEALHHSLFLELNLLDIHGILPLIVNGLELELKSELKLLLGLGLVQVLGIPLLLVFISPYAILELLQLVIGLVDVHVDDVHLREALEDLPEQVVFELIVRLDIEFLKEIVLSLLV